MRRRRWPERSDRPARPKVQRLSAVERDNYLNAMMRAIERSPVLTSLSFDVRILRGRFYVERACRDADGTLIGTETMGRITPLADAAASLLLEVEFSGTCLYICRDGRWAAYTIRPSESDRISSAKTWLEKRKWRAWT